jgi:hypothetical protein
MGFFSWLTGAKSVDKTLEIIDKSSDGIMKGVDKIWYTEEEKAENLVERLKIAEQMSKTHIELMKATADENTTRSVTRRVTAIVILTITALSIFFISFIWKYDPKWSEWILQVSQIFYVPWAFIAVVIYFFGNHMITRFKK